MEVFSSVKQESTAYIVKSENVYQGTVGTEESVSNVQSVNIVEQKETYASELHSQSILRDISKLNQIATEIPYCMFRACEAQEYIVKKDDQESQFSFGSCIVYLTAFCARLAVENHSWFHQKVHVTTPEGVIATEVWQETQLWIQRIGNVWRQHVPARYAIDICEGAKGISMIPGLTLSPQMLDIVKKTPSMTEWQQREYINNTNKPTRWSELTLICTQEWCVNRDPGNVQQYCVQQVCKDMPSSLQWLAKKVAKRSKKSVKRIKVENNNPVSTQNYNININSQDEECTDTEEEEEESSLNITPYTSIATTFDSKIVPTGVSDTIEPITITRRGEARNFMQKRKRENTDILGSPSFVLEQVPLSPQYTDTSSISNNTLLPTVSTHPTGKISTQKHYSLNSTTEARIYCVTHVVLVCSEYGTRPILYSHCSALQLEQHAVLLGRWLLDLSADFPHTHVLNREIVVEIAASLLICKHNGVILAPSVLRALALVIELLISESQTSSITQRNNGAVAKTSVFLPIIASTQSKAEKGALFAQYHANYQIGMFFQLVVADSFGGLGRASYPTGEHVVLPNTHVNPNNNTYSLQYTTLYPKLPHMHSDCFVTQLPTPETVDSLSVRRKDALQRRMIEDTNNILMSSTLCACSLCSGDMPVIPRDCAAQVLAQCKYTSKSSIPAYLHVHSTNPIENPLSIYYGLPCAHEKYSLNIHVDVASTCIIPPAIQNNTLTKFVNTATSVRNRTTFWPDTYHQPSTIPLVPTGVGSYKMAQQRYNQTQSFLLEKEFNASSQKRYGKNDMKSSYPFVHYPSNVKMES